MIDPDDVAPLTLRDDPHVREIWCDGLVFEDYGDGAVRVVAYATRNAVSTRPSHQITARLVMPRATALAACEDCEALLAPAHKPDSP